jgi:hypothetical protein
LRPLKDQNPSGHRSQPQFHPNIRYYLEILAIAPIIAKAIPESSQHLFRYLQSNHGRIVIMLSEYRIFSRWQRAIFFGSNAIHCNGHMPPPVVRAALQLKTDRNSGTAMVGRYHGKIIDRADHRCRCHGHRFRGDARANIG